MLCSRPRTRRVHLEGKPVENAAILVVRLLGRLVHQPVKVRVKARVKVRDMGEDQC